MFTVCPKCALTLVVTAADLRIAQGYVRCGRCLNVFNALARLSEERPGAAAVPAPEHGGPSAPEALPSPPASPMPSPRPSPPSSPTPSPLSAAEDTGEIEVELDPSIFVTATRPPAPRRDEAETEAQALEPEPPVPRAPAPQVREPQAPEPRDPEPPSPEPEAAHEPAAAPKTNSSAQELEPEPTRESTQEVAPESEPSIDLLAGHSRTGLAWRLGAGALALALALQIVNHFRNALAANPALSGPLRSIYSAVGVTLAPPWNVRAYDVRQLGASVDGSTPGEIVVRASVRNSASDPQPLPFLRVTLQDRFGNRIAARDVPPRDYLPASVSSSSLLAAGSRVDATMVFVDPGPQAVGFEIDACLPLAAGTAAHADPARTAAATCAHGP
jgi:predicted Zn finger-like uncharacterized protein